MHVYITGDCPYEESYKIQYRQDVVHGYDGTVYFTTMISSISIFYRQREIKGHFNLTFPCELLLIDISFKVHKSPPTKDTPLIKPYFRCTESALNMCTSTNIYELIAYSL
jgi:hypothetical protein